MSKNDNKKGRKSKTQIEKVLVSNTRHLEGSDIEGAGSTLSHISYNKFVASPLVSSIMGLTYIVLIGDEIWQKKLFGTTIFDILYH